MKKITLLVASILFVGNIANAETTHYLGEKNFIANFDMDEPIAFVERGITFYVFPDGQFDFNTETTVTTNDGIYYRNGRRASNANVNTTYGAPGVRNGQGVKIEHDSQGRIRRVGNVFVNYDAYNRIKRIGTVYMSYNRYALSQIGGLQLIYNRRGEIVDMMGSVKGNDYAGNNGSYYYGNGSGYQNGNTNNNSNYYYRTDKTPEKEK
ncbi:hypothetical protein [Flavobacterium microcysteis]|uniref:Uncharacterized protein n=1 Tax=Flavobacterium microcysteis TaxID=2596891 RepID=A0A501QHX6_9FLAO|nr:hypothetical protein [Flavobacterium microcysteis]TPD72034.1 hypothetical protein FJA49_03885 [Flavobacterium microcysteis]